MPAPSAPSLALLHALLPPGNLAAKVSVATADGPESFGAALDPDPERAAAALDGLVGSGHLLDAGGPGAWAYRIVRDGQPSLGLVVAVDRAGGSPPSPLASRRGVEPAVANVRGTLPPAVLELMRSATTERPLFHFKAADGLTHTGWTIADAAAVAAGLATVGPVECPEPAPGRFVGRVLPPDAPALPPRLGLFVRRLGSVAAVPP